MPLLGFVFEGDALGVRLEKKIERIDHRQRSGEIDLDLQLVATLGKYQPRQIIRLGVLLPVDEVLRRCHRQRVGQNRRSRMRRRPQANHLWPDQDRSRIAIVGDVAECDMNGHGLLPAPGAVPIMFGTCVKPSAITVRGQA